MDKIKLLLLEWWKENCDDILGLYDNVAPYLSLWDAAFVAIYVIDQWVQPKVRGMEHHVVNQIQIIQGGMMEILEHWVEQYHQMGYKYDDIRRTLGDEGKKVRVIEHVVQSILQAMRKVWEKLDEFDKNTFGGKRKRSVVKVKMLRDVKRETLKEAVNSASIMYENENDHKCKGV